MFLTKQKTNKLAYDISVSISELSLAQRLHAFCKATQPTGGDGFASSTPPGLDLAHTAASSELFDNKDDRAPENSHQA